MKEEKKKKIEWIKINPRYMSICRYAIFVIAVAIIIYLLTSHIDDTLNALGNMIKIVTPFLLGVLFAYFLNPMVKRFDGLFQKAAKGKKKILTKILAMIISYIIVLGFIAIAFVFVIPQMVDSVRELTNKVPGAYEKIEKELNVLEKRYPELGLDKMDKKIGDFVPDLVGYGTNVITNVVPMLYSFSVSLVKTVINIVLGLIISIYLIFSKNGFVYDAKRFIYALFDEEKGDAVCTTIRECNDIFSAFLISKAIDSLIIGCMCCAIMSLLGLPYAVLLSVIVGITNMIPFFGPFIGAVPGVLIYLCVDWELAIVFAIMILALQQFDGLILGPKLLGDSTGLSPIWVIFAITVGGAYFGFVGMFIGVPVVAVIAHLCNKFIKSRLEGRDIKALKQSSVSDEPTDRVS